MGGTSEREHREKLNRIREKANRQSKEIRSEIGRMEKIKADALKRAEDMRRSADKEISKTTEQITKSKDLAPESKQRLSSEIAMLKNEMENNYTILRRQIAETLVPVAA